MKGCGIDTGTRRVSQNRQIERDKAAAEAQAALDRDLMPTTPASTSAKPSPDPINHPSHYTFSSIEVIAAIEAWGLGFHLGNVVKYVARAGRKGPEVEDLLKAKWYLDRRIEQTGEVKMTPKELLHRVREAAKVEPHTVDCASLRHREWRDEDDPAYVTRASGMLPCSCWKDKILSLLEEEK